MSQNWLVLQPRFSSEMIRLDIREGIPHLERRLGDNDCHIASTQFPASFETDVKSHDATL